MTNIDKINLLKNALDTGFITYIEYIKLSIKLRSEHLKNCDSRYKAITKVNYI